MILVVDAVEASLAVLAMLSSVVSATVAARVVSLTLPVVEEVR